MSPLLPILALMVLLLTGCGGVADQAPVAASQSVALVQNGTATGYCQGRDADGDAITWTLISAPLHGQLVFDTASGYFTYVPLAGFSGQDLFSFRCDTVGAVSNVASVTLIIAPTAAG